LGSGEHHNVLGGTVHGSVVQARDIANLHVHFARTPIPVPRQLPPAPTQFVNRQVELGHLDRLIEQSRTVGSAPVAVLTGGHGVGKSATGKYWAHINSERFADGQLYADLGEIRHRGGVSINDLLGGFLRALGLDDVVIPVDLAERTALFRSRLAGKRLLVLLDDVEHAAQVKPLIPASADCVVLVTSRGQLEELVFDGAEVVHVAPLDDNSSHALLVAMIGIERVTTDPAAVTAIARICGGLPVALRICGAQLAGPRRDKPVSWLAARLADETRRLSRLSRGPGHSLQAVFDDAYRGLGTEAARLYRALGLHRGPNATPAVAAASLLWPVEKALDALDELSAARLIEDDGERFRFHDLLRTHARRTAEREESVAEQETIVQNIVAFYVAAAQRMDRAVMPDRLRMAAPPPPATADQPVFSSPAEALTWFDDERANLVAAVRTSHEREWDQQAWQLGEAMWIAYNNHKNFDEAREVYTFAVEASTRAGDRDVEARMRQQLARGEIDLQNYAAAELELERAEGLAERSSNPLLRASIIEFVGILQFDRGEHEVAVEAFERARAACETIGYTRGVVLQEYFLGRVLAAMRRPRDAIEHLQRAEALVDGVADPLTHGRVLIRLGEAQSAASETSAAAASLTAAAAIMGRNEVPYYAALALEGLADVRRREGDAVDEAQHLTAALAIYDALGSPRSQAISVRLEQLAG
jgi:tetratricopeptide (TPR) repeat protein